MPFPVNLSHGCFRTAALLIVKLNTESLKPFEMVHHNQVNKDVTSKRLGWRHLLKNLWGRMQRNNKQEVGCQHCKHKMGSHKLPILLPVRMLHLEWHLFCFLHCILPHRFPGICAQIMYLFFSFLRFPLAIILALLAFWLTCFVPNGNHYSLVA